MRRFLRYKELSLFVLVLGLLSVAFAGPLLASVLKRGVALFLLNGSRDGWWAPYFRSAAFAIATSLVCIPIGFWIALILKDCHKVLGMLLALLMAPILMGSVAIAFCVKLDVIHSSIVTRLIENRAFVPTWGLMLSCQAWQLLTLSTYLFWFRLQQVPVSVLRFAAASRLTGFEYIRDVYWPQTKNLAGILAIFSTTISFYAFATFALVIRASPGTGTELASNWLLRLYNFYSSLDPRIASARCLAMSAVAIFVAVLTILCSVYLTLSCLDLSVRGLARWGNSGPAHRHPVRSTALAVCVLLAAAFPMFGLLPYLDLSNFIPANEFLRSVGLAFAASLVAVVVSIILGISGRLLLRRTMERFDSRSALVFAGVYFLQVVPGIAIALCGYYWLAVIAASASLAQWVPVLWLICQVIIALPLTASFVQLSHFRVRTDEIDFQESAKIGLYDIVSQSFVRRFSLDYVLVGIYGFSVIWTESTINSTLSNLSQSIPSVAVELTQRVDGRGGSYPQAANLIAATLFPIFAGLVLWVFNARRRSILSPDRYSAPTDRRGD